MTTQNVANAENEELKELNQVLHKVSFMLAKLISARGCTLILYWNTRKPAAFRVQSNLSENQDRC